MLLPGSHVSASKALRFLPLNWVWGKPGSGTQKTVTRSAEGLLSEVVPKRSACCRTAALDEGLQRRITARGPRRVFGSSLGLSIARRQERKSGSEPHFPSGLTAGTGIGRLWPRERRGYVERRLLASK